MPKETMVCKGVFAIDTRWKNRLMYALIFVDIVLVLCLCGLIYKTLYVNDAPPVWPETEAGIPLTPQSMDDFVSVYKYAAFNQVDTLHLSYPKSDGFTEAGVSQLIQDSAHAFYQSYPEYSTYSKPARFSKKETKKTVDITLHFAVREGCDPNWLPQSVEMAQAAYQGLVEDGALSPDMSETDRAKVILQWVCDNMEYNYDETLLTTTPWCGFANGYGACGCYTGMYNLLLREDGITCHGRYGWPRNDPDMYHEWTVAVLDGETLNIDPTWCDSVDFRYFAKTDEEFSASHGWEASWLDGEAVSEAGQSYTADD